MRVTRRRFIAAGAVAGTAGALAGARAAMPAPRRADAAETRSTPAGAGAYRPVVTPNGWSLPWRRNGGWKEFHLVAEPVTRALAPGLVAHLWGYNGETPGPTIECVEGDRVRILVTNALAEPTTILWPGLPVPHGMSGLAGSIPPGQTFAYSFAMTRSGTFLYRPHWDAAAQAAMGLVGAIVVHPRDPAQHRADCDFVLLANGYDLATAREGPRLHAPLWTLNGRVFPGIDALAVRAGDCVRIRIANFAAASLALLVHGHAFAVTGTGGGWVPETARWPETAIALPAGALRAIEFKAAADGDWPLQCLPPRASGIEAAGAPGGMTTAIKVRVSLDDHRDPGSCMHPAGGRARAAEEALAAPLRRPAAPDQGRHVEVMVTRTRSRG
jgi:FtsP/CotA-like multicopper oxidase with cupredoxin domain